MTWPGRPYQRNQIYLFPHLALSFDFSDHHLPPYIPPRARIMSDTATIVEHSTASVGGSGSVNGHIHASGSLHTSAPDPNLDSYDDEQVRLMEERCILINEKDEAYGEDSKKTCKYYILSASPFWAMGRCGEGSRTIGHLMSNINQGLLHRAFSVFLFRPSDGRLLLQKRADEKITFPSMWTNTCCSHPLSIRAELVEENQAGVRAAAIRKLPHELGIPPQQLKADDFTFLTRIHYLAPSDGLWGEHESESAHSLRLPV